MKYLAASFLLFSIMSCSGPKTNDTTEVKTGFYIGTYTNGASEGIYYYQINSKGEIDSIKLAAKSNNPSFLAFSKNKDFLIAANEVSDSTGNGSVELFKKEKSELTLINKSKSGGAYTCFVAANENNYVIAANYMGGNVGLLKIQDNGSLSELLNVQQHTGSGTHSRQEAPHAHSAWFLPDMQNHVISVDLGTNELWFSSIDSTNDALVLSEQTKLAMAAEAGPRHLTIHPNGKYIYVLNELNGTVSLVQKNANGEYEITNTVSTLPEGFTDYNKSADIHITADGKFLYASNRGPNTLAIFNVNGENGELSLIGFESTKGDGPRNFALSPDENFLLVANQQTNNIVSFKRDKETGLLTFVDEIYVPAPVCILFE